MPPTGWDEGQLTRVKEATKKFLKRFGPLIVTGLAAVAEHHWLGHEDESENTQSRNRAEDPEDKRSIRKLEREVSELKRSLLQKPDEAPREAGPSPRIREWRPPYQEGQTGDQYPRGRSLADAGAGPSSYQAYQQIPTTQHLQTPRQGCPVQYVPVQEREYMRPSQRQYSIQRRRRRHRHSSVPNRNSYERDFSDEASHAGKLSMIAGAIEAVHVGDIPGDWFGPKGVRVGTTMAATYAASRSRDRDTDFFRRREVVADVGTGLLVSRLVHGSSRRLEDNERLERRGRRWSYCY